MDNFIKKAFSQLNGFWKGIDSASRKKIIVAVVLLLVVAGAITWIISNPDYVVLYSGLDGKEAGEILLKLEDMNIKAKPEGLGTIKVPKKDEPTVRMQLAAEGYPKSGFNYDFIKDSMGIGTTDLDKRRLEQIQLQERLQSAIKTMDGVEDAIVTINIPNQDSFVLKDDKQEAIASVLLNIKTTLSSNQVKGIEALVAKSVLGLKSENISIVDSNMNVLNSFDAGETGVANSQFELEMQVRDRFQKQVLALLEPVFGKSNVLSSVSVRLNFDKKLTNSVRFEPAQGSDEGIAVSINELKEEVTGGSSGDTLTDQTQYAVGGNDGGDYTRTDRTVNYEVNQIKEQLEQAQGTIKELKLSVIINNSELSEETLDSVEQIVSTAIGVDQDNIVVRGMAFNGAIADKDELDRLTEEARKKERNKLYVDYAIKLGLALMLMFVLFILYRFISKIKFSINNVYSEKEKLEKQAAQQAILEEVIEMPEEGKEQILKKKRIDNLIDNKPEIVAKQIRDWLNES